ncbi:hypothetical protein AGMMS49938_17390 [Fibrobacterales bacterium]|nr:hypothetical protein AGMMS49938_17390 [Fibrobacterales bacterium]
MAIGSISGQTAGSGQLAGERQGTVVAQENDENNKMKTGIGNQPVNAAKSEEGTKSIVEQQNAENNTMQAGIDNQNLNDTKGVQQVNTVV